jgi:hypothetical protein
MSIEHDIPQGLGRGRSGLAARRTIRAVIGLGSAIAFKTIPVDVLGQPIAKEWRVSER